MKIDDNLLNIGITEKIIVDAIKNIKPDFFDGLSVEKIEIGLTSKDSFLIDVICFDHYKFSEYEINYVLNDYEIPSYYPYQNYNGIGMKFGKCINIKFFDINRIKRQKKLDLIIID